MGGKDCSSVREIKSVRGSSKNYVLEQKNKKYRTDTRERVGRGKQRFSGRQQKGPGTRTRQTRQSEGKRGTTITIHDPQTDKVCMQEASKVDEYVNFGKVDDPQAYQK